MQLIRLDLPVIRDARRPLDLELAVHRLVLKDALVHSWSLLILALVPGTVLERAVEPALASGLQILKLSLGHVATFEESLVNRLAVGEVQSAFSMSLIHLVDLAVVSGAVAVADVLDWQAGERVCRGRLNRAARALLTGGTGRSLRARLCVLLLQLRCHFNN